VSGHTSRVFVSAGYLHARYGLATAAPAYVLATVTAYSRVHTEHHFVRQVAAGAAVGVASAFLFTEPFSERRQISLVPTTGGLAFSYSARW
jgi:membrane-associated phospholipid phosphatase